MDNKPSGYLCRKWTAFTLCLFNIVAVIATVVIFIDITTKAFQIAKSVNQGHLSAANSNQLNNADLEVVEKGWEIFRNILIVMTVITVLIHVLGLFGIYRDHFYLVMIYAVILVIALILCVVAIFRSGPIFIGLLILSLPLDIFAFLFANDIHKHMRTISANNLSTVWAPEPQISIYGYPNSAQTIPMETLEPDALAVPPSYNSVTNAYKTYN